MLEVLLDHGATLDARSEHEGWTALMWAVSVGSLAMVQYFITRGADVNATVKRGYWTGCTALMVAIYKNYPHIIHFLLDAGVDVTLRNAQGETALEAAVTRMLDVDIIERLTDLVIGPECGSADRDSAGPHTGTPGL